jgi:hypothetical protein
MVMQQQRRNDLCRCKSGKKFKKCCGRSRSTGPTGPALWAQPPGQDAPVGREDTNYYFVNDKGWIHKDELKPGDQYKVKEGGWETFRPTRMIRTTEEHPFWVKDKGWTPAGELKEGDLVRTMDGWVPITKIEETNKWEPVYNVRVADAHTYFVGDANWPFAVWAHNLSCAEVNEIVRKVMRDEKVIPNPNGLGGIAQRPGIRAEWASRDYLVQHLVGRIGQLYSTTQLAPSDVNTIANLAATRMLQAEGRDPQATSFKTLPLNPSDAQFVPQSSAVPANLTSIAHRQYTINRAPNQSETVNPITLNLNDGGWDTALAVQLHSAGFPKTAKGLYVLRNPTTGLIFKVGKADSGGLIGRLEWYAKHWLSRGVQLQAEVYPLACSGRTLWDAETVLRGQIAADGWALASDGTADHQNDPGFHGWTAGVRN